MKVLEELFCIYEENSCSKSIDESWKKCVAELDMIPYESIDNVKDLIHGYARECEKASFETGFCYGISLMLEFMSNSGASNV